MPPLEGEGGGLLSCPCLDKSSCMIGSGQDTHGYRRAKGPWGIADGGLSLLNHRIYCTTALDNWVR